MSGPLFHIAVFGASGATGREVVAGAVERGWQVNALVRRGGAIPATVRGVREIVGSLAPGEALRATVAGANAIVIAIGPRPPYEDIFCAAATAAIVEAARRDGVRRLVCLTGALIGDYPQNRGAVFALMGRLFARSAPEAARDRVAQEEAVRQSDLEWTLVKPPRLTLGPARGRVRIGPEVRVGLFSSISRKDLAAVLLDLCADGSAAGETLFVQGE